MKQYTPQLTGGQLPDIPSPSTYQQQHLAVAASSAELPKMPEIAPVELPELPEFSPSAELYMTVGALYNSDDTLSYKFGDVAGAVSAGDVLRNVQLDYSNSTYDNAIRTVFANGSIDPACGGTVKVSPVGSYKYAVFSTDRMSLTRQWGLSQIAKLPFKLAVLSDSRIYYVVQVNAEDSAQYEQRCLEVRDYLFRRGYAIELSADVDVCDQTLPVAGTIAPTGPVRLLGDAQQPGVFPQASQGWQTFQLARLMEQYNAPKLCDWSEWQDNPVELPDPIVGELVRRGWVGLLAADGKVGKTYSLMDLAAAVATGGVWLGHRCHKGRVLYLDPELDAPLASQRVHDIRHYAGRRIPKGAVTHMCWRANVPDLESLLSFVEGLCGIESFDLILLDSVYRFELCHGDGDENSSAQATAEFTRIMRCASLCNAAVVASDHLNKSTAQSGFARIIGSVRKVSAPDAIMVIDELSATDQQLEAGDMERRRTLYTTALEDAGVALPATTEVHALKEYATHTLPEPARAAMLARDRYLTEHTHPRAATMQYKLRGASHAPTDLFWSWPTMVVDHGGMLRDCVYGSSSENDRHSRYGHQPKSTDGSGKPAAQARQDKADGLDAAYASLYDPASGGVHKDTLAREMSVSERTIRDWCKSNPLYTCDRGIVRRINDAQKAATHSHPNLPSSQVDGHFSRWKRTGKTRHPKRQTRR